MKKLRWLKSYQGSNIGEEFNAGEKSAENFVSQGFAEYVENDEDRQKQARYLQDKTTLDNHIGNKTCTELDLKILNVLPENYDRWKKEQDNNKPNIEKENEIRFEQSTNQYIKFSREGFPYVLIDELIDNEFDLKKIKTIYGKRSEDVWTYDDNTGLWNLDGRGVIKSKCETILGTYSKIKVVNEIFEKIKRQTVTSREDFFDKEIPNLICVNNGVLDVTKDELKSFSPDYNFRTKLDIDFKKEADCPAIKNFIEDTFYEEDISVIQEWFGFHLYKEHFIKKALILFGNKNTGKTILLNLLITFVGEKNKTGISLHKISKGEKFTLAFLKDKLANIYDDLSDDDLKDKGGFKIATGGGFITAEYKFGDTFEFLNYAKNTFATNKIPMVEGKSDEAYYLRWLPIPCDNEVPEKEQDKFLLKKLTTKEELSGLLNWALTGLQRLLKNGMFSYNKTIEEIKTLMEKHSNNLLAFCIDCIVEEESGKITKEEMYQIYSLYMQEKKQNRLTKTGLGRNLEKYCIYIKAMNENKERYWTNVGLNKNFKLKIDGKETTINTLLDKIRKENNEQKKLNTKNSTDNTFLKKTYINPIVKTSENSNKNDNNKLNNTNFTNRFTHANSENVLSVVDKEKDNKSIDFNEIDNSEVNSEGWVN